MLNIKFILYYFYTLMILIVIYGVIFIKLNFTFINYYLLLPIFF